MALSVATIRAELEKLFDPTNPEHPGYPSTPAGAGTNLANALHVYFGEMSFPDATTGIVGGSFDAGEAACVAVISTMTASSATALTGEFTDGFQAYAEALEPGNPTPVVGCDVSAPTLGPNFGAMAGSYPSHVDAAATMAAIIHAWAITGTGTTPPSSTPPPPGGPGAGAPAAWS